MIKPKDRCEIRLSEADVEKAIQDYLNVNVRMEFISVTQVRTSQSNNYILVVEFE